MTALDDALDSSAPMFAPVKVFAEWAELPDTASSDTSPDSLRDLSNQVGPSGVQVTHSLDDGLPDPVTLTSQNDASGSMKVDLVGRPQQYADTIGWRTSTKGGAVTAAPVFTFPTDIITGDYCLIVLEVASSTVTLSSVSDGWTVLGESADSTGPVKVFVLGRHYVTGMTVPVVLVSNLLQTAWISSAAYAKTASQTVHVDFRSNQFAAAAEAVSQTTHTAPSVTLSRRGYVVGVWAGLNASGAWTPTGTDTELQDTVGTTGTLSLAVTTTTLRDPGSYTVASVSAVANDDVAMAAIALEVWDRPAMGALKLFSPFNSDSPYYGWDRDTAPVRADFGVITEDGTVDTTIFQGQMVDITVAGRTAEMDAVSKTRLDMNRSLTLPVVWANRENCTVDWLATWLMARAGQFVGPAPNWLTRYWNPFYGSIHGSYEASLSYSSALLYNVDGGPFGVRPPTVVDGPYLLGMEAHQEDLTTHEIRIGFRPSTEVLPYLGDTQPFHDQISQQNTTGRLTVWLRGDAVDATPTYPPTDGLIFRYRLYGLDVAGQIIAGMECGVKATRELYIQMGNQAGFATFTSSLTLPTDGNWHFIGFTWDWFAGTYRFRVDGTATSGGVLATTDTHPLATDQAYWDAGGTVANYVRSHVPISDLLIDAGPEAHTEAWSLFYPTPQSPGQTVTMRSLSQTIEVIAGDAPVNAWDTLAELARASLSHYRTNELDNIEFLPLKYFGEDAQMTSTAVMDTEVNAGELDVKSDPTKTRNVVTVKFNQTLADGTISPVLVMSSAVEIPRGVSSVQFYLDTPSAEIHGAANPNSATWILTNLTSSQIATPSTIPAGVHYMSVNSKQDGTGTVIASNALGVVGKIVDYDSSTVTLQFTNKTPSVAWLSNNGDQVPFLNVLGYAVRITPGYVTARDPGSIGTRRERALDVEIDWIHNRRTATDVAQALVTMLAHPRPEVSVQVMGDPRRKPGQLVTLADSDGTQASGTWRILAVEHPVSGPQYIQQLALVRVLPPGLWDGLDGWDNAVWGD